MMKEYWDTMKWMMILTHNHFWMEISCSQNAHSFLLTFTVLSSVKIIFGMLWYWMLSNCEQNCIRWFLYALSSPTFVGWPKYWVLLSFRIPLAFDGEIDKLNDNFVSVCLGSAWMDTIMPSYIKASIIEGLPLIRDICWDLRYW